MNLPKLRLHVPGAASAAAPLLDPSLTEDEAAIVIVVRAIGLNPADACEFMVRGHRQRHAPVPFRPKGGAS